MTTCTSSDLAAGETGSAAAYHEQIALHVSHDIDFMQAKLHDITMRRGSDKGPAICRHELLSGAALAWCASPLYFCRAQTQPLCFRSLCRRRGSTRFPSALLQGTDTALVLSISVQASREALLPAAVNAERPGAGREALVSAFPQGADMTLMCLSYFVIQNRHQGRLAAVNAEQGGAAQCMSAGRNHDIYRFLLCISNQASREVLLLAAVNAERRGGGREAMPRLTMRALRGFLRGKAVGGRPWTPPASRRRDDLVTDAMCVEDVLSVL